MSDLKDQVVISADLLQDVWRELQGSSLRRKLPTACYERWQLLSDMHRDLTNMAPLFDLRDKAWNMVQSLVDSNRISEERRRVMSTPSDPTITVMNFSHDSVAMDFQEARYLTLVSYMAPVWAIYDRLSNICGRIAATEMVQKHIKQNPKLVEDFLTREKEKSDSGIEPKKQGSSRSSADRDEYGNQLFAFSMQFHMQKAYAWPAKVSYGIRNWLVHEGSLAGSIGLFAGSGIADGLILSNDAVSLLEKRCSLQYDANGDPDNCCLKGTFSPWRNKDQSSSQSVDLLKVLELYHAEVDIMFTGLLKWSVDSFMGQIVAFTSRDRS